MLSSSITHIEIKNFFSSIRNENDSLFNVSSSIEVPVLTANINTSIDLVNTSLRVKGILKIRYDKQTTKELK